MLLTEKKKGVSQNGQTPSIIGICSYCVLDRPVFERCQTLLHPELTPWWSFPLADGAHHKKPHSPTHHNYSTYHNDLSNESQESQVEPNDFIHHLKVFRNSNAKNALIGSLNINSLRHKFQTIEYILKNGFIDIMGICETKLDNSFPEAQFSIKNFKCHRQDRMCHGGGLIMYVKSDIPHRRRHDFENLVCNASPNHSVEMIIVEAVMNKRDKWVYVLANILACA